MGLYDFNLYDVIVQNAVLFENEPAWMENDRDVPLTFRVIKKRVDRLARALSGFGCKQGDRIGVIGKNCLEFFEIYGAAAALGAIVLPINWRLSSGEAAYVINHTDPLWVFADNENPQLIEEVQNKISEKVRFLNLQPGQGVLEDLPMDADSDFKPADVSPDDGFVIFHTAAVNGHPRGALLSHGNLLCSHLLLMRSFGLRPTDIHLNTLPLFQAAGLIMAFCAFHAGVLNINFPKFDAGWIVQRLAEGIGSFMFTLAPMLKAILDEQQRTDANIRSLQTVMGIESADVIERYQEVSGGTFLTMYGQTETSLLTTTSPYNHCPGAVGRPVALSTIQLMDENDQPVAKGQVGEIVMRGPMVFKGYWGFEANKRQTFRNGWHHTGDLGRMDQNGYLWYLGRKADKELIKPNGEKVYPAEVEEAILAHPAIEAAVVFGVPDPKWKEGIKAVCMLYKGKTLNAQNLIDFVGQRIAWYKKPRQVEFVKDLPLKTNGDIDRSKVKAMYGGR